MRKKGEIQVLSPEVANLIAAGEVVERPASVVKELLENAIDAGSTSITIEIRKGGINYLRITDNGCGIPSHQLATAFLRHATSKLQRAEHLSEITTLGFRGEALAAIAAVSKVRVTSGVSGETFAHCIKLEGGVVLELEETGAPSGTTIIVEDIFFNTPARKKFMKTDRGEGAAIYSLVQVVALSHPEIAVKFIRDGKTELSTSGDGVLQTAIFHVLGKDIALGLRPVKYRHFDTELEGFVSLPSCCRASRNFQHFFVNGRYIKSPMLCRALEEAYLNQKMIGKFPAAVLHLQLDVRDVDVNVHPAKTQVKFAKEKEIFRIFLYGVTASLESYRDIQKVVLTAPTTKCDTIQKKPEREENTKYKDNQKTVANTKSEENTICNEIPKSIANTKSEENTKSKEGRQSPPSTSTRESVATGEKPLPWQEESIEKMEDSIFNQEWKSMLADGFSTSATEEEDSSEMDISGNPSSIHGKNFSVTMELPASEPYDSVLCSPICKDPTMRGLYPSLGERKYQALEQEKQRLAMQSQEFGMGESQAANQEENQDVNQEDSFLHSLKDISVPMDFLETEDSPLAKFRQIPFKAGEVASTSSRQRIDSKYDVKPEVSVKDLLHEQVSVLEEYSFDPVAPCPWKVVGEFLRTYVMVELEDELFFIDKHAAHERLNFNRLKAQGYRPMEQQLIEEITVELSPEEQACVKQYESLWGEFAFDVVEGERNQVILKAVPHTMNLEEVAQGFVTLLDDLMQYPVVNPDEMCDHMLHSISCKAAIKAGYDTSQEELEAIAQLVMENQVRHCPHGRPIVSALTRKELEKKFGRST